MKSYTKIFFAAFLAVILSGCKNDSTSNVDVKYNVVKGEDGNAIISANIANTSGNALKNIQISFYTTDHQVISYTSEGVICAGQNADIDIETGIATDFIESYEVKSCETTMCE